MHPMFRHVPPRNWRSMQATFMPSCAARMAATYPPGPAPITTRSNCVSLGFSLIGSSSDARQVGFHADPRLLDGLHPVVPQPLGVLRLAVGDQDAAAGRHDRA